MSLNPRFTIIAPKQTSDRLGALSTFKNPRKEWQPWEDETLWECLRDKQSQGRPVDWNAMEESLRKVLPGRSLRAIQVRYSGGRDMPYRKGEDTLLLQKSANQGHFDWSEISKLFPERSSEACRTRASLLQVPYRRGGSRWSKEEDTLLIQKTANQGHFDWIEISKLFPERSPDACRNRASLLERREPLE